MANLFIPRDRVHSASDTIGANAEAHQSAFQRLLKDQRRLTRFLEENQEAMDAVTSGITVYLYGVVARIFDLEGGRLKSANWAQVRSASAKVGQALGQILPAGEDFPEKVRALSDRAQPHLLDEALMALFDHSHAKEGEEELDHAQAIKVFSLLWVAVEVLDQNWRPAKNFVGESDYEYVHITPTVPS